MILLKIFRGVLQEKARLYEKEQRKEFEFLKLIDRGRVKDNIRVVKSYDEWEK